MAKIRHCQGLEGAGAKFVIRQGKSRYFCCLLGKAQKHFIFYGQHQTTVICTLKNIELVLEESQLVLAELYLEQGQPTHLEQVEPRLWVAQFPPFEVEVQLSGDRVVDVSCECTTFNPGSLCAHVGATLMAIRRVRTTERVTSAKPKTPGNPLHINHVLEHADANELRAFIRQYARKNRQFSLALKTRFAPAIPAEDPFSKYEALLDAAFKQVVSRKGHITRRGSETLASLTELLAKQLEDCLALEHYAECFAMLRASLERLPAMVAKCTEGNQVLVTALHGLAPLLEKLSLAELPPALGDELWMWCIDHLSRRSCRETGLSPYLVRAAVARADTPHRKAATLDAFLKLWQHPRSSSSLLVACFECLLPMLRQTDGDLHVICSQLKQGASAEVLYRCSKKAAEQGALELASLLASETLLLSPPTDQRIELLELLLHHALGERNSEKYLWALENLFSITGEKSYLHACLEAWPALWPQVKKSILRQNVHGHSDGFNAVLATVLEVEGKWKELLQLIDSTAELWDMLPFLPGLSHYLPEDAHQALCAKLDDYLRSHFGPVPAKKTVELLRFVRQNCPPAFHRRLEKYVQVHYPEKLQL